MTRYAIGLLITATWAVAQTEQELWRDFLARYRAGERKDEAIRPGYCEAVRLTGAECDKRFVLIKLLSLEHSDDINAARFERIYARKDPGFQVAPTALLAKAIEDVPAGRALDVHMGQGRNSVYLAQLGWNVTGFDISPEAIRLARMQADQAGVSIDARVTGHKDFEFDKNQWDLIVMTYSWLPLQDAALIDRIVDSLKPGGRLLFEHYERPPCAPPGKDEWLPCANEALRIFGKLRVLFYEEKRDLPDWSSKANDLVRLVGQKAR